MKNPLVVLSALLLAVMGTCQGADKTVTSDPVPGLQLKTFVQVLQDRQKPKGSEYAHHDRVANRLWLTSLAIAGAATSMDAATSWGKREGNSFLASSNGTFGARGLSLKAGLFAAAVLPQVVVRHNETYKKRFAIANFIEAGIFTGISIHNTGVAAAR